MIQNYVPQKFHNSSCRWAIQPHSWFCIGTHVFTKHFLQYMIISMYLLLRFMFSLHSISSINSSRQQSSIISFQYCILIHRYRSQPFQPLSCIPSQAQPCNEKLILIIFCQTSVAISNHQPNPTYLHTLNNVSSIPWMLVMVAKCGYSLPYGYTSIPCMPVMLARRFPLQTFSQFNNRSPFNLSIPSFPIYIRSPHYASLTVMKTQKSNSFHSLLINFQHKQFQCSALMLHFPMILSPSQSVRWSHFASGTHGPIWQKNC